MGRKRIFESALLYMFLPVYLCDTLPWRWLVEDWIRVNLQHGIGIQLARVQWSFRQAHDLLLLRADLILFSVLSLCAVIIWEALALSVWGLRSFNVILVCLCLDSTLVGCENNAGFFPLDYLPGHKILFCGVLNVWRLLSLFLCLNFEFLRCPSINV